MEARLENLENMMMPMVQNLTNQSLEQRPSLMPAEFPDNAEEMK